MPTTLHFSSRPKLAIIHALRLHEGKSRHTGGNFHHVRSLLTSMMPMADRRNWRLLVLVDEDGRRDLEDVVSRDRLCCIGACSGLLGEELAVARLLVQSKPDLYYRPTGQLPLVPQPCMEVMGVADLNFRWLKTSVAKRIYKEFSYSWSFLRACGVVCISEFTRLDVAEKFCVRLSRLHTILHGPNRLAPEKYPDWAPQPHQFWLTFGHQAHKNVELILRAMAVAPDSETQPILVVVGQSEHISSCLKPLARQLRIEGRVLFAGKVAAEHLSWLYRNALGLLFVSKFEGFGLPVLEAMQVGCPVIASSIPPLKEVAGGAAVFCDASDHKGLAKAMGIWRREPFERMLIGERGRERAKCFSWDRAASATFDVFDQVAEYGASTDVL